jgi:hypothetical protein
MTGRIDAGGSGGAYARGVVAQAQAAILPQVRALIAESIGRIAVRAGGNLTAIGIRSALMFDPAATAVMDDPDHEQIIVPLSSGGGAISLIETKEITTPTAAPLSFTVPGTYRHLWLMGQVRVTDATLWTDVIGQFNGDTAAFHYGRLQDYFDSVSHALTYQATRGSIPIGLGAGASAAAGYAGLVDVLIPHYRSPFYKQVLMRGHHTDDNVATNYALHNEGGGIWYSTAAITSLEVRGGTFDTGTLLSLYGLS